MIKTTTACLALLCVLAAVPLSAQGVMLDTELLSNTGFEGAALTGWNVSSGGFAIEQYGTQNHPSTLIAALMSGGNYLVRGTTNASMSQTIDVTGNSTDVDLGTRAMKVSGHFGGRTGDTDRMRLNVRYFNSSGGELFVPFTTAQIGAITSTHRNFETTLMRLEGTFPIPSGTRSVVVEVNSTYSNSSAGCNSLADNLSAMMVVNQTPPALPTGVELLDNGGLETGRIINPALTGWIVTSGSFRIEQYGAPNVPLPPTSIAISGGNFLLAGNSNATIQQSFDLSGNASTVDFGNLSVRLQGAFGGRTGDTDRALMRARFFGVGGGQLLQPFETAQIGAITSTHRNGTTTMMSLDGTFQIPVGTRRLVIEVESIYSNSSVGCNALADNLSATLVPTQVPPALPLGTNLLDNPGFESGQVINPALTGWIVTSGSFGIVPYGAVSFPLPSVSNSIGGGAFMLRGNGNATIQQYFDVSGDASQIDAGNRGVRLEGYLGGFGSDSDRTLLRITFRTQFGGPISSVSVGPVTAAQRGNVTTLLYRQGDFTIPFGTRSMILEVETIYGNSGNGGCNAVADNIAISLLNTTTPLVYPGTGEDFRLRSGVNGPVSGGPNQDVKSASAGNLLTLLLDSPMGSFNGQPLVVLGLEFATINGAPTPPAGLPGVQIDFGSPFFTIVDGVTPLGPFGPPTVLPGGNFIPLPPIPAGLSGRSLLIQGFTVDATASNGLFAASEAHEIQVQ